MDATEFLRLLRSRFSIRRDGRLALFRPSSQEPKSTALLAFFLHEIVCHDASRDMIQVDGDYPMLGCFSDNCDDAKTKVRSDLEKEGGQPWIWIPTTVPQESISRCESAFCPNACRHHARVTSLFEPETKISL
jgi:hypothetical protein